MFPCRRGVCRRVAVTALVIFAVSLITMLPVHEVLGRTSTFTSRNSGILFWTTYGYNQQKNAIMPESLWQKNIDWVAANFAPYGYTLVTDDGWQDAQAINSDGYPTTLPGYTNTLGYWSNYARQKGLAFGLYENPLRFHPQAWIDNPIIKGTTPTQCNGGACHVRDIATAQCSLAAYGVTSEPCLTDIDPSKPGAREWVDNYFAYLKSINVSMLTLDFMSDYYNHVGPSNYSTALRWLQEDAGNSIYLKVDINYCSTTTCPETTYLDDVRSSWDSNGGGWTFLSDSGRSSTGTPSSCGQCFNNSWDGFDWQRWNNITGPGKAMSDGDFQSMQAYSSNDERQTALSLYLLAGSPIGIQDYCDDDSTNTGGNKTGPCTSAGSAASVSNGSPVDFFRSNDELLSYHQGGVVGAPISSITDQRWKAQLPDGSWLVGLFNRETTAQARSVTFSTDLGISGTQTIHNVWSHCDLSSGTGYSTTLNAHASVLLHVGGINDTTGCTGTPTSIDDSTTGTALNQFNFTGSWGGCTNCQGGGSGYFNNSMHWNNAGSTASIQFSGPAVALYGGRGPNFGYYGVKVCDANAQNCGTEQIVDGYRASPEVGSQLIAVFTGVSSGTHTLVVRATGTKNTASSDAYITPDRVLVAPASQTTSGTVLFSDDFEGYSVGSAPSGWSPSGGTWAICQPAGETKAYCKSDTSDNASVVGSTSWTNYYIDAYANMSSNSGSNTLSVLARVQDTSHYYEFGLTSSGGTPHWELWRNNGGNWTKLNSGSYSWSANTWYKLRLTVTGSTLSCSVSSDYGSSYTPLGSVNDTTFSYGEVGVKNWGSTGRFDNVTVVSQ